MAHTVNCLKSIRDNLELILEIMQENRTRDSNIISLLECLLESANSSISQSHNESMVLFAERRKIALEIHRIKFNLANPGCGENNLDRAESYDSIG